VDAEEIFDQVEEVGEAVLVGAHQHVHGVLLVEDDLLRVEVLDRGVEDPRVVHLDGDRLLGLALHHLRLEHALEKLGPL
jgi:hypothetical protein